VVGPTDSDGRHVPPVLDCRQSIRCHDGLTVEQDGRSSNLWR
jgi:hypothetical protein